MEAVNHSHLLPEVTQVDINNTMNAQNGSAIGESMLTSPLPTNQHFPAGVIPVEPRRIPTGTTAERRRDGNAIDNDCATITINIATYNIRDGRNSNLEAALRACEQMRIHFAVLTETKLSTDRYTRSAYGYTVFATKTNHINQGGIAVIFTNNSLYFQVKSQQRHGPNVISCILRTGRLQHPIIGAYIPPGTTTLSYISDASQRFQGQPIILMGDINVDLRTTTPDNRDAEIMALLSTLGLEDMSMHFIQQQGFRHGNTWHMMREGTRLKARCDYILGTNRRIFQYIRLKNPNYNSDHLMVMGGIRSGENADNIKYL
jgi:exonuclease III